MHTAPIAKLPFSPNPPASREETHGDDFAFHLRNEARETSRNDEPRSAEHHETDRPEPRPRASETDYERISSDDDTKPVEQSTDNQRPEERKTPSKLSDTDTETPDAAASLEEPAESPQTATVEQASADQTTSKLEDLGTNLIKSEPKVVETSASVVPTATADDPAGTLSANQAVGDTTPGATLSQEPPALGSSDPQAIAQTKDQGAQIPPNIATLDSAIANAGASRNIASNAMSPASMVDGPDAIKLPGADNNAAYQAAAPRTPPSTAGLRAGLNSANDPANKSAPIVNITSEDIAEGETEGETAFILGSTNKSNNITNGSSQAGQQTAGTTTNGTTANQVSTAEIAPKDISAANDPAIRSNDQPLPAATQGSNQAVSTASAFGSELKLVSDVSVGTETAASRNTPNAAASQLAVQITRAVQDGQEKFVVNLKPANLGKVSVQLEVGHDNRVIAVIAAERPETLELLQRDSRALELALKEAGLKADSGSLSFSLQGDGTEESPFDDQSSSDHAIAIHQDGEEMDTLPTTSAQAYAADASGVDIHV